jgi:hypothetical protein
LPYKNTELAGRFKGVREPHQNEQKRQGRRRERHARSSDFAGQLNALF